MKTVNYDPNCKFNVRDVKRVLRLGMGFTSEFVYNDGSTIVVLAGYGAEGAKRADDITCLFPFWDSSVRTSDRPGSINDTVAWTKAGVHKMHFVCLSLPLRTPETLGECMRELSCPETFRATRNALAGDAVREHLNTK